MNQLSKNLAEDWTPFWSVPLYDDKGWMPVNEHNAYSFDNVTSKKNKDGSVTIFFGPKAPKGQESNWIPTAGKRPFPVIRIYGGTEAFWDKSWKMPDLEIVK